MSIPAGGILPAMPTAIPLWNGAAPGTVTDPSRAQEPAALEQPHLVPFLIASRSAGFPRATIIVCPGGGYGTRAQHEGEPIARWLNALGINAFVLHYRHAPFRHPVPLQDAQRAIRLVRSRAGEWGEHGSLARTRVQRSGSPARTIKPFGWVE